MNNITAVLVVSFLISPSVFAVEEGFSGVASLSQIAANIAQTIGVEDLHIESTGLLPSNPFYFMKEFGRGVKRFFNFSPEKKFLLELQFLNEKMAEVVRVKELRPDDIRSFDRAIAGYAEVEKRVESQIHTLQNVSTSSLKSVFNSVARLLVAHEKMLREMMTRENNEAHTETLGALQERLLKITTQLAETTDETAFFDTLENVMLSLDRTLEERSAILDFIDRLSLEASESLRVAVNRLRSDIGKNFVIEETE
ncbi:MAG: DUF5667 domain-containing protein [bacterium]|nr:DUF5667 domain-containing protein [bacterium]